LWLDPPYLELGVEVGHESRLSQIVVWPIFQLITSSSPELEQLRIRKTAEPTTASGVVRHSIKSVLIDKSVGVSLRLLDFFRRRGHWMAAPIFFHLE
jgi:hypothetical protein